MNIEKEIHERSGSKCELCGSVDNLTIYVIPPTSEESIDNCIHVCGTCLGQIENPETIVVDHWRCLNDSMWSTVPAVQIMAWRMLHRLRSEGWPQDLLEMLYLDEETLARAQALGDEASKDEKTIHLDSNGSVLEAGDTVVLTKTLDVKGSSITAKRGTAVRRISLVDGNPEQIEGKVDGQQIVILTKFVKKSL